MGQKESISKKSYDPKKFLALLVAAILLASIAPIASADPGWWDTDWSQRKPITITENSGSTLTNYQVELTVTYDSDMKNNFDDLRFTNASGTELDYWIESRTDGDSATVWVEVDSLAASSDTTIYMYYGNSEASSASVGSSTFQYFDHWTSDNTGNWTYGVPTKNYRHRWENTKEFTESRELRKKSALVNWWPGTWDHTHVGWTKDKSSRFWDVDHVAIEWNQRTDYGASSDNVLVRLHVKKGDNDPTYTEFKNVAKPDPTDNLSVILTYSSGVVSYEWKNLTTGEVLASDEITDPSVIPDLADAKYLFTSSLSNYVDYFSHVSPTYLKWGNPYSNGGMEWKTDYWFIKKYALSEPSAIFGNEEESHSQRWYLSSTDSGLNKVMYKGSPSEGAEPVLVEWLEEAIWIADEPAGVDVGFPAGDWTGHLRKTGDGDKFEVEIGVWDGSDFYFWGYYDEGDFGASNDADFTIRADSFTVFEDEWLAFRVTNWDAEYDFYIVTAGGSSYVSSPSTDPGYPVPELPTIILFSIGLVVLMGYAGYRRKNNLRGRKENE